VVSGRDLGIFKRAMSSIPHASGVSRADIEESADGENVTWLSGRLKESAKKTLIVNDTGRGENWGSKWVFDERKILEALPGRLCSPPEIVLEKPNVDILQYLHTIGIVPRVRIEPIGQALNIADSRRIAFYHEHEGVRKAVVVENPSLAEVLVMRLKTEISVSVNDPAALATVKLRDVGRDALSKAISLSRNPELLRNGQIAIELDDIVEKRLDKVMLALFLTPSDRPYSTPEIAKMSGIPYSSVQELLVREFEKGRPVSQRGDHRMTKYFEMTSHEAFRKRLQTKLTPDGRTKALYLLQRARVEKVI
jgi:hypothetical protein